MRALEPLFELFYQGIPITVSEHQLKTKRVFHIDFKGFKKPLVITVALNRNEEKFWTSIPEGKQQEAEEIGKMIADYIRAKR